MKLDKAIEILGIFRDEGEVDLPIDVDPAITLGIEALKAVQKVRHHPWPEEILKLPGETNK